MRRREFVAGGIALAAGKTTLASLAWAQSAAPRIDRIIDVHCHVFNAADLPIEGFARRILVPKSVQTNELVARFADYPGALEALVHALTVQVKRGAPDMQTEIDRIDGFERNPEKNRRVHGAGKRIAGNCAVCCGSSGSTGTFSASGHCH
jgi:hypothetical protein